MRPRLAVVAVTALVALVLVGVSPVPAGAQTTDCPAVTHAGLPSGSTCLSGDRDVVVGGTSTVRPAQEATAEVSGQTTARGTDDVAGGAATQVGNQTLPLTGADIAELVAIGALLVVLGATLVWRRRTRAALQGTATP